MSSAAALSRRTNSPARSTQLKVSKQDGGRSARIHSSACLMFSERTGSSAQVRRTHSPTCLTRSERVDKARPRRPHSPRHTSSPAHSMLSERSNRAKERKSARSSARLTFSEHAEESIVERRAHSPRRTHSPLDVFQLFLMEHGGERGQQPTTQPHPRPLDILRAFWGEHDGAKGQQPYPKPHPLDIFQAFWGEHGGEVSWLKMYPQPRPLGVL